MFHASPKFMEKLEAESKSSSTLPPDQRVFLDAARAGDANKIQELLAKGVPVDLREDFCLHYHQSEQTALMYAAGTGHLEIVRILLKAGANVNAIDKMMSREDGGEKTVLHYAAEQPNVAVVEELLNAGADPNALTKNAWNRGYTPLIYALRAGNREVVRLLIKHGTNLSSKIGRKQAMSPLCAAIDAQRDDVPAATIRDLVLLLLEAGADPNGTGDANATAIYRLALVEANNPKEIPFDIANELLGKLLKAGAKPDWLDKFGSPPLENAILRQNPGAVKLLLEAGADVNRIFVRGTALDINDKETAQCEKDKLALEASPPPADEKMKERQKRFRVLLQDKLQRCKEIGEILRNFGAKQKSELSQTA
ncbi:MAG TPA: ankyrin repeat domain-containing protein [Verrucomicrobiae bacterium]